MNGIESLTTITVAVMGLVGIFLTNRKVGKVDKTNTEQHDRAVAERTAAEERRQTAHDELVGKVEAVHNDVRLTSMHLGTELGKLAGKLEIHMKDQHAHDEAA